MESETKLLTVFDNNAVRNCPIFHTNYTVLNPTVMVSYCFAK